MNKEELKKHLEEHSISDEELQAYTPVSEYLVNKKWSDEIQQWMATIHRVERTPDGEEVVVMHGVAVRETQVEIDDWVKNWKPESERNVENE